MAQEKFASLFRFLYATSVVASLAGPAFSLPRPVSQEDARASLITKDDFTRRLQELKSAALRIPEPFVVSTRIAVRPSDDSASGNGNRRSRSFKDADGHTVIEGVRLPDDESDRTTWRNGKVINNLFVPDGAALPAESVVSTDLRRPRSFGANWDVLVPESRKSNPTSSGGFPEPSFDFDDHYSGREPDLPDSLALESMKAEDAIVGGQDESDSGREFSYLAGNTNSGRPVYYVVSDEEKESLYDDRGPYDYEPADHQSITYSSSASSRPQAATRRHHDPLGAGPEAQADPDDFVIKQHTYTMCPGCPTFSIPIPIPKSTLGQGQNVDYHRKSTAANAVDPKHRSFLEMVGDRIVTTAKDVRNAAAKFMNPLLKTGKGFLRGDVNQVATDRVDQVSGYGYSRQGVAADPATEEGNLMPLMVGGGMAAAAAAALGAYVFMTTTPEKLNLDHRLRSFKDKSGQDLDEKASKIEKWVEGLSQKYDQEAA